MLEDDLLRLTWVADPQISPDGTRIAFVRVTVDAEADEYRTNLWIADIQNGTVRALTFGGRDSQPRWSPDGTRLVFVRAPAAGEPGQVHVLPMAGGGEPWRLTELVKGASSPVWSPDGTRVAFCSSTDPAKDVKDEKKPKNAPARIVTRPMFRFDNEGFMDFEHPDHVWVVRAEPSASPVQLTSGRFSERSPAWSSDGARVLFLSDRREEPWFGPEDADVHAVTAERTSPAAEGDVELVADAAGPIQQFAVGTASSLLGLGTLVQDPPRSYDQGDLFLFEAPWPARTARVLTGPYDFEVGHEIASDCHPPRGGGATPLALVDGGRAVITTVARHGRAMLAKIGVEDGRVTELSGEAHEIGAGTLSGDGRRAALVAGSLESPGVLALWEEGKPGLRVLHDPNAELFAKTPLGPVEEFWYESFDGTKIQAWLVSPPGDDGTKKLPLVLQIHGGPHVAYGIGFFHEFRVLAAAGYRVLYTNPRGSTTYGQAFGNVIQYAYPKDDFKDLMAGVEHVIARGLVDETKIGVTGGSGGGLLTNWAIAHSDRFKAAITQRCVSEWASFWYGCDFTMFTPFWFEKPPHEDPAAYRALSPVTHLDKVKTPLLVLHSEDDLRTPIVQGEAMFRGLASLKKPVAMARFPGEGHELSRSGAPSRRVQNQRLIRRWFDRWLLGKEAAEFDGPTTLVEAGR
jgi:dipeptidyl aminopeptidase/acylaminoacyl peptidase